jgi:hypothetical protein
MGSANEELQDYIDFFFHEKQKLHDYLDFFFNEKQEGICQSPRVAWYSLCNFTKTGGSAFRPQNSARMPWGI